MEFVTAPSGQHVATRHAGPNRRDVFTLVCVSACTVITAGHQHLMERAQQQAVRKAVHQKNAMGNPQHTVGQSVRMSGWRDVCLPWLPGGADLDHCDGAGQLLRFGFFPAAGLHALCLE